MHVSPCSLLYLAQLVRGETGHSVHVFWRAQRFEAVVLARLGRPAHADNATECNAEQEVEHAIIQNIVAGVGVQIERLEGVKSEGRHRCCEGRMDAREEVQKKARTRVLDWQLLSGGG